MKALIDVVVLVAVAVVAQRGAVDGLRDLGGVIDRRRRSSASPRARAGGGLQRGERAPGVARREPHQWSRRRRRAERDRAGEPARVGDRAVDQHRARSSSVSGSSVSRSERDSSGEITENDGFSVVAAIRMTQPFSTPGQQGVLLGLGEAVDLVEEQHGLPAVQVAARAAPPP